MALTGRPGPNEALEAARSSPLLASCEGSVLGDLCTQAYCHDYPANNYLLHRGDPPGAVYLVLEGRVKLTMADEHGREVIVDIVFPGELVGLESALEGGPQPSDAVTAEPSRLARFRGDRFARAARVDPALQDALLRLLARRVRQAYKKVWEHALLDVKDRLLYTLAEIAEREGRPDGDGEDVVFTRPTHQELAYRIGSSREVVTRVLKEILESDLLQAEGRVIRIPMSALVLRDE